MDLIALHAALFLEDIVVDHRPINPFVKIKVGYYKIPILACNARRQMEVVFVEVAVQITQFVISMDIITILDWIYA